MYRVSIEQFEGPLDLLLEIIEQKKLPLLEIRLSGIAQDFISYIRQLEDRQPEELVSFLVVASRLALLKSRELVPSDKNADEEDGSIEELEKRLARYQPFRRGAKALQSLDREHKQLYAREAFVNHEAIEYIPESLSAEDLKEALTSLLANTTLPQRIPQAEVTVTVSIEECIAELEKVLQGKKRLDFSQFIQEKNKSEKVAHFMGMLQLVRNNGAQASQKSPFSNIVISTK